MRLFWYRYRWTSDKPLRFSSEFGLLEDIAFALTECILIQNFSEAYSKEELIFHILGLVKIRWI